MVRCSDRWIRSLVAAGVLLLVACHPYSRVCGELRSPREVTPKELCCRSEIVKVVVVRPSPARTDSLVLTLSNESGRAISAILLGTGFSRTYTRWGREVVEAGVQGSLTEGRFESDPWQPGTSREMELTFAYLSCRNYGLTVNVSEVLYAPQKEQSAEDGAPGPERLSRPETE